MKLLPLWLPVTLPLTRIAQIWLTPECGRNESSVGADENGVLRFMIVYVFQATVCVCVCDMRLRWEANQIITVREPASLPQKSQKQLTKTELCKPRYSSCMFNEAAPLWFCLATARASTARPIQDIFTWQKASLRNSLWSTDLLLMKNRKTVWKQNKDLWNAPKHLQSLTVEWENTLISWFYWVLKNLIFLFVWKNSSARLMQKRIKKQKK